MIRVHSQTENYIDSRQTPHSLPEGSRNGWPISRSVRELCGKGEKNVDVEKKSACADDSGSNANETSAGVDEIPASAEKKSAFADEKSASAKGKFAFVNGKSAFAKELSACVNGMSASAEKKSTSALFSVLSRLFLDSKLITV